MNQNLKPGISGIIPVRDVERLDYAWELAVSSLIPICNEVIISDGGSTDGTLHKAMAWCAREPKIRVVSYDFGDPVGDVTMLPRWVNHARTNFCRFWCQIQLDADEVLCPKSYPVLLRGAQQRKAFWIQRLNFWKDAHHIAPHHTVCAHTVVRFGPTELEAVCDGMYNPEPPIKRKALTDPSLRIFHLGFLRKREAFFAKSKIVQRAILNTYDPRLKESEESGKPWTDNCSNWEQPLINYNGDYPPGVPEWLAVRGFPV